MSRSFSSLEFLFASTAAIWVMPARCEAQARSISLSGVVPLYSAATAIQPEEWVSICTLGGSSTGFRV
jgi:hypothetical protein